MQTRTIGPLHVSEVGLGCNNFGWRLDEQASIDVVHAALDAGITFFDTADVYGADFETARGGGTSEEFLGKALAGRRDDAVIATKFGSAMGQDPQRAGASRRWIEEAVEDSLRRLGTDRIDLYQLHRDDPDVPIEETIGALSDLVDAGKIRAFGHSNFSSVLVNAAADAGSDAPSGFVSAQNHWSLLKREVEDDVVPACERHGIALIPFFPLASGMLTGKFKRGAEAPAGTRLGDTPEDRRGFFVNDQAFDVVERLESWASARGHGLAELALAWLLAHDVVGSVIAGATSAAQVQANAAASGWVLTEAERLEVAALTEPA